MPLLAAPPPSGFSPWFLPIAIGGWLLVSFLISGMGWSGFAGKYPARVRPAGRAFNVPSAQFGWFPGGYRNVVRVVFAEEGVYFYVLFLFRAFHSPFLLPWESVVRVVEKKHFFFGRHFDMVVEDGAGSIRLWLPQKMEQELLRDVPQERLQRVAE